MTDMEKVVKGLECCAARNGSCRYKQEPICPYVEHCQKKDYAALKRDALSALKKQEAVEPTFRQDEDGIFVWACGSCGAYMYHIYDGIDKAKEYAKYCRQCGKKVKWDD